MTCADTCSRAMAGSGGGDKKKKEKESLVQVPQQETVVWSDVKDLPQSLTSKMMPRHVVLCFTFFNHHFLALSSLACRY